MEEYFIDLLRLLIYAGDKIVSRTRSMRPTLLAYLLEIDFGKRRRALLVRWCVSFHMNLPNMGDSPIAENAVFCEI